MLTGNVERGFTKLFRSALDAKFSGEIVQLVSGRAIVGACAEAVGNCTLPVAAKTRRIRIIEAVESAPGRLCEQLSENNLDRQEICIKIEMLLLNIQDESVLGTVKLERPVAFIAFRDKIFA